jgi:hypothetical protein
MTTCTCDNPKMFYWAFENKMYAACSNCNAALKPPPILTRYGKKLKALEDEPPQDSSGGSDVSEWDLR